MQKERELFTAAREIREFGNLVTNPTEKIQSEITSIETIATSVGLTTMLETVRPFLELEQKATIATRGEMTALTLTPLPDSSLSLLKHPMNTESPQTLTRQIVAGMIMHYAFIHNDRFTIPSPERVHGDIELISPDVVWENEYYHFYRPGSAREYAASFPVFIEALKLMPFTTTNSIATSVDGLRELTTN